MANKFDLNSSSLYSFFKNKGAGEAPSISGNIDPRVVSQITRLLENQFRQTIGRLDSLVGQAKSGQSISNALGNLNNEMSVLRNLRSLSQSFRIPPGELTRLSRLMQSRHQSASYFNSKALLQEKFGDSSIFSQQAWIGERRRQESLLRGRMSDANSFTQGTLSSAIKEQELRRRSAEGRIQEARLFSNSTLGTSIAERKRIDEKVKDALGFSQGTLGATIASDRARDKNLESRIKDARSFSLGTLKETISDEKRIEKLKKEEVRIEGQRVKEEQKRLRDDASFYRTQHTEAMKIGKTVGHQYFSNAENKHWKDALRNREFLLKEINRLKTEELPGVLSSGNPHKISILQNHIMQMEQLEGMGTSMLNHRMPLFGMLQKTKWGQSVLNRLPGLVEGMGYAGAAFRAANAVLTFPTSYSSYYGKLYGQAKPFFDASIMAAAGGMYGGYSGAGMLERNQDRLAHSGMGWLDLKYLGGILPQSRGGAYRYLRTLGNAAYRPGAFFGMNPDALAAYQQQMIKMGYNSPSNIGGAYGPTFGSFISTVGHNRLSRDEFSRMYTQMLSSNISRSGISGGVGGFTNYLSKLVNGGSAYFRNPSNISSFYNSISGMTSGMGSNPGHTILGLMTSQRMTNNFNVHTMMSKFGLSRETAQQVATVARTVSPVYASQQFLSMTSTGNYAHKVFKGNLATLQQIGLGAIAPSILASGMGQPLEPTIAATHALNAGTPYAEIPGVLPNTAAATKARHALGGAKSAAFLSAQSVESGVLDALQSFSDDVNSFNRGVIGLKQSFMDFFRYFGGSPNSTNAPSSPIIKH